MYLYDELDRTLVTERVAEFRDQVGRRLSGELTEEEFRPLRLMNGIYLQLHAYMLRIAIPYGTLSSVQMRMLAHVARRYDRNFGHFTTRQNIQFHWIKLEELPDAMADLASVGLHGMQTSGNCVRNITTDQWAGVARRRRTSRRAGVGGMTSPLQQKLKITGPVVVTANRLTDGAVVYWRADGGWTMRLGGAAVAISAAAARELLAAASVDQTRAVGAYIAPVKIAADGELQPGNLREAIRSTGPTVETRSETRIAC